MKVIKKVLYHSDAPVAEKKADRFERYSFAQRIANVIKALHDHSSMVIGVFGKWGSGKTTVLNFIATELQKTSKIICIRFNPWRYGEEAALLKNFFNSMAESLGQSIPTKKEVIGEWLKKYGSFVASIVGQTKAVESVGEILSSLTLEEERKRLERILKSEDKRVVVLIDDVDRLEKSEIQSLFRLIKLVADFSYTTYILACDEEMVANAISERFGTNNIQAGRDFLKKIIQVQIHLPILLHDKLREFCFINIDQALQDAGIILSDEDQRRFARLFINGIESRLKTPRDVKRYCNILSFSASILKDKVNIVDLILIEAIRVFFPQHYESISKNKEIFAGRSSQITKEHGNEKTRNLIEHLNKGISQQAGEEILWLLNELFPKLRATYQNYSYDALAEREWADNQLVCSAIYFDKYFTYTISKENLSDEDIARFLSSLLDERDNIHTEMFESILYSPKISIPLLLSKFTRKLDSLNEKQALNLALLLSKYSDQYPKDIGVSSHLSPFSQAAMLIIDILSKIPSEDKIYLLEDCISGNNPLFSLELLEWLSFKPELRYILSDVKIANLKEQIAYNIIGEIEFRASDKIDKELKNYLVINGVRFLRLFSSTFDDSNFESRLHNILDFANVSSPSDGSEELFISFFLKSFVPNKLRIIREEYTKVSFKQEQFEELEKVINPEIILKKLRSIYYEKIEVDEFPKYNEDLSLLLAQQFYWIYQKKLEKKPEE